MSSADLIWLELLMTERQPLSHEDMNEGYQSDARWFFEPYSL